MTDREQIRRDAEMYSQPFTNAPGGFINTTRTLARHCLALLAELEQAERERDRETKLAASWWDKCQALESRIFKAEARLAETEQAERQHRMVERQAIKFANDQTDQLAQLQAKLAKVPALVEAGKELAVVLASLQAYAPDWELPADQLSIWAEALAAWDTE
jgi:hypothetical protein